MDVSQETNQTVADTKTEAVAVEEKRHFNRAKVWQIAFFAANNTATNAYMFLMMNVAYFATGIVGLGTVLVSTIITASRIFDGVTDPIIGMWIDKTNGKYGKFRPFSGGWVYLNDYRYDSDVLYKSARS